jgi:hypothetical protein
MLLYSLIQLVNPVVSTVSDFYFIQQHSSWMPIYSLLQSANATSFIRTFTDFHFIQQQI